MLGVCGCIPSVGATTSTPWHTVQRKEEAVTIPQRRAEYSTQQSKHGVHGDYVTAEAYEVVVGVAVCLCLHWAKLKMLLHITTYEKIRVLSTETLKMWYY